jgi:hypothetical protein
MTNPNAAALADEILNKLKWRNGDKQGLTDWFSLDKINLIVDALRSYAAPPSAEGDVRARLRKAIQQGWDNSRDGFEIDEMVDAVLPLLRSPPSSGGGMGEKAITCLDDTGLQIVRELYKAVSDLKGANICLLAMIGSWGDTLDDNDILAGLRRNNEMGECFVPDVSASPSPIQPEGKK